MKIFQVSAFVLLGLIAAPAWAQTSRHAAQFQLRAWRAKHRFDRALFQKDWPQRRSGAR